MADEYEIAAVFTGMNATMTPEALPPGQMQSLVDGVIVGNRNGQPGGIIQSRPGKAALLTSVLPGKITYAKRYRDPSGTQHLILAVADVSSTTGYLYDWVKGATACTRLTALGIFNSYQVQIDLLSTYAYIIGNVDGKLRRTDLTGTFAVAASPNAPSTALVPQLVPWFTDTSNTSSQWRLDYLTGNSDVPDGTFSTASNGGHTATGWTEVGSITYQNASPIYTTLSVQLDDAPSYIVTTNYIANPPKANAYNSFGGENGTGTGSTRYAQHFLFTAQYYTDGGGYNDSVYARVYAYDSGNNLLESLTQVFAPKQVTSMVNIGHMFSFDNLGENDIASYKVELGNPGIAARPGGNGPYLTDISCVPYLPQVVFTNDGSSTLGLSGFGTFNSYTLSSLDKDAADQLIVFWGGFRVSHQFATAIDFTQFTTISIPIALNITPSTIGLRAKLNLKTSSSVPGISSNPLLVLTGANGQVYLQTDVSSLEVTNGLGTTLSNIGIMEIIFLSDTDIVTGTSLADKPLVLSPLTFAGNLSINLDYSTRYTEATTNDPATALESGGSPISGEFVPTGLAASYTTTLPAPINTSAPVTAFYGIYRQGGTFSDPYYRLEAMLPFATGITTIPNLSWNSGTGTYTGTSAITGIADFTWNPTTRVYHSNIPDSDLDSATFLFDHDGTPTNATSIAVYQNRLTLGVGSLLYISALTTGISAGLYFNDAPDTSSPYYTIQGNLISVGAQQGTTLGESIRRVIAYRGRAIIFFETRTFVLQGINNTNFSVYEDAAIKDVGLLAPNALTIVDNLLWLLSSEGVHDYDFARLNPDLAYPIAALINPGGMAFGEALPASSYAKSSFISHAGRLLISTPGNPSSSAIDVTYVCDLRQGAAWYQWDLGEVLCGESFSGSDDQDELVIGCGDGMLYGLGNGVYGDTATAGGTASPVRTTGLLRRVTDQQFSLMPLTFSGILDVTDSGTIPFIFTVNTANSVTFSETIPMPTGDDILIPSHANGLRIPNYLRGRYLEMAFSFTSTGQTTLRRMSLKYCRSYRI